MLVVGFDAETIEKAIWFAENYDFIYAAVGWHPVDAIDFNDESEKLIRKYAAHDKVVAIGEIGLDYYWDKSPHDIQKEVLLKQIKIAKEYDLPIIIHNRDATKDLYDLLKEEDVSSITGVMHCFSSSSEMAIEFVKLGLYISLAGPITFKNGKRQKEVAKAIDISKIVIETDCPYLAPHPNRGKRNEPSYVKLVAEEIATQKDMTFDEVAKTTYENALKLFKIQD
jgi:TatD DNase family protein